MATALTTAALGPATWALFEELVERHAGVWGGCWCMGFHQEGFGSSAEENHRRKRDRVASGSAFAALVLAEGRCVGWCQYGPATDLTRLKNRKAYEQGSTSAPDWRITCFFVDRHWRHRGVANLALQAAVGLIAAGGGGVVESYPEDAADRLPAHLESFILDEFLGQVAVVEIGILLLVQCHHLSLQVG